MHVKDKMKTKTIIIISILLLMMFLFAGFMVRNTDNSNSWTKALCNYEVGELEQRIIYDTCWIEGKDYRAKFVRTGEYYSNATNSDEIKRWRLIER